MIQPVGPTNVTSVQVTRTKRSRNVNAIAAVPSVQHIASLRKILATLFTLECMILAEYIEFIIPLLYGNYVLMMVHLPSARYHTELTSVTMENVVSTVYMVFLYGLLEVGSFILLVLLLKRGCGMQALYHLAFVLETQMLPIQSKIIGWTLITLGFRVVHFGTMIFCSTMIRELALTHFYLQASMLPFNFHGSLTKIASNDVIIKTMPRHLKQSHVTVPRFQLLVPY
ncbi:hypothetical protein JG688_00005677 [Phytophthora aleatoria]|uniref:Transmembrane protein n=1 Tax=Phytophthora aleatoria TaxID=2496075 RepID=A0A8J5J0H5_9STRA|nr:hypothetical protein JG688_00005677 [Phytophthora aleatoria]